MGGREGRRSERRSERKESTVFHPFLSPDMSWSPERRGPALETRQPSLFYFISGQVIEAEGLKGKLGGPSQYMCIYIQCHIW